VKGPAGLPGGGPFGRGCLETRSTGKSGITWPSPCMITARRPLFAKFLQDVPRCQQEQAQTPRGMSRLPEIKGSFFRFSGLFLPFFKLETRKTIMQYRGNYFPFFPVRVFWVCCA